jgi:hypothetical protein
MILYIGDNDPPDFVRPSWYFNTYWINSHTGKVWYLAVKIVHLPDGCNWELAPLWQESTLAFEPLITNVREIMGYL